MCGRYYVDDDTEDEIERIIMQLDQKQKEQKLNRIKMEAHDIRPTDMAPVLMKQDERISCKELKWGFTGYEKGQLLINARIETALEKSTFRESVMQRRIVIPATMFYEWNKEKNKFEFTRKDKHAIFMAGCYRKEETGNRFIIFTTKANNSISDIHDRMPLILEENEISNWIMNENVPSEILFKTPCELDKRTEYKQYSLFDIQEQ